MLCEWNVKLAFIWSIIYHLSQVRLARNSLVPSQKPLHQRHSEEWACPNDMGVETHQRLPNPRAR